MACRESPSGWMLYLQRLEWQSCIVNCHGSVSMSQKAGGGELRKASVAALLSEVVEPIIPDAEAQDLQDVTDEGSTTTNGISLGGNLVVGEPIFGGAPTTNVGVEADADKGALHIRSANNNAIATFEILSAGSQLSHLKILGSGDLKIGDNVNTESGINIELNPDGSATFTGPIEAESIDGGTY